LVFATGLLSPVLVFAQASVSGLVQDPSGAVLPGVTVEAASPALIEKARTAVTDWAGRYSIVDLRPAARRTSTTARSTTRTASGSAIGRSRSATS
jgi:hypothetical protein